MGGCSCGSAPKLVFACSGAADVGAVADRAARMVSAEGAGKMFCTAGIGGRVSGIMKTTEGAAKIVALDGCPLDCVKQSLENAGFKDYTHVRVTDMGMEKGKTEVSDENIGKVADAVRKALEC
ncbi:MAG: putative zinc-binding protein [Planctomycetes bacterium]|nr:putative zinc-binding protein [Planctomycetota bacterium]